MKEFYQRIIESMRKHPEKWAAFIFLVLLMLIVIYKLGELAGKQAVLKGL